MTVNAGTSTDSTAQVGTPPEDPSDWFVVAERWTDMGAWHRGVGDIRRTTPVLRADRPGFDPFWVLTRHADVFEASRDNQTWHNTERSVLGPEADYDKLTASGMPMPKTLVHLDGQAHTDHRKVTSDWFKPAAVSKRQPRIDSIADEFVERLHGLGGRCDFARDIAQPFTLRVIMDIYGVPPEDEPLMLELTQGIFGAADPEYLGDAASVDAKVMESVMRFIQFFAEVTQDRQACPTDDLASVIANGEIDGCPMDGEHQLWYYIIVATAGHDTTSFALSGGLELLARNPSQWAALAADPDLINNAADEIIRYTSPVRHFMRYAQSDTRIGDVEIPSGGRVLLSYPSANRDEAVFDDPDRFDITRPDADKLLSFGVGAHFCLGAQFARRELRTMLRRLSQELDHVELDGEVSYAQSHFVSGVKSLPITYSFR